MFVLSLCLFFYFYSKCQRDTAFVNFTHSFCVSSLLTLSRAKSSCWHLYHFPRQQIAIVVSAFLGKIATNSLFPTSQMCIFANFVFEFLTVGWTKQAV